MSKVNHPEEASQFRPISLCNVVYKIISKILVNRLKPILQQLVSPFQNAFVPGRLMSDNCLIAHEVDNKLKKQKKGKEFMATLKVDMYKAYDKVDWKFLDWILMRMGFEQKFRHWVMQCVTTVSYSVLINGEPSKKFKPSCGLRQGDSLSPYLFILVMEVFSQMISQEEVQGRLQGIKISRSSPAISHLFFADDSLLFFKASPQSCATIKNLIQRFSRVSGEVINFTKSAIMFSPNTPQRFKRFLRSIIGTQSTEELGKYLGNDIEVDGRSTSWFGPIVEKIKNRVGDWSSLALSHARKILFINAILAAMCQHVLSVFLLPKKISDDINRIFARFLWRNGSDNRGIFWKRRQVIELPKGMGGLGVRNVHAYNVALMAKQAVRIHEKKDTLIAKILVSKYRGSPVSYGLKGTKIAGASWGFQGLCKAISRCRGGFSKVIINGRGTRILEDKWVEGPPLQLKSGITLSSRNLTIVADLICTDLRSWNAPLILDVFKLDSASRILGIYLPNNAGREDEVFWSRNSTGRISAKDAYSLLISDSKNSEAHTKGKAFWSHLWSMKIKPKWKVFLWRILNKALAVQSNLEKRGIMIMEKCSFCQNSVENEDHLFRDCAVINRVWLASHLGIQVRGSEYIPLASWVSNFLKKFWKEEGKMSEGGLWFCAILWAVWTQRNHIIFRGANPNPCQILRLAEQMFYEEKRRWEVENKMKDNGGERKIEGREILKFS